VAWIYLVLATLFEFAFTTCLQLSNNFSNPKYRIGFFISTIMSFILLNKAVQAIPMGTGYAVWTGIGAVGTVIIGILFFREPVDFWRVFFIFLLIGSILGLKFISHS
jgi:quaternary ammonium compound-resistance protein SugE